MCTIQCVCLQHLDIVVCEYARVCSLFYTPPSRCLLCMRTVPVADMSGGTHGWNSSRGMVDPYHKDSIYWSMCVGRGWGGGARHGHLLPQRFYTLGMPPEGAHADLSRLATVVLEFEQRPGRMGLPTWDRHVLQTTSLLLESCLDGGITQADHA